jgi:hypothetical protein
MAYTRTDISLTDFEAYLIHMVNYHLRLILLTWVNVRHCTAGALGRKPSVHCMVSGENLLHDLHLGAINDSI